MVQIFLRKFPALLFLTLFSPVLASSTSVNIGILTEYKITSLLISSNSGEYFLTGDGKRICEVKDNVSISILVNGDSILVKKQGNIIGNFRNILLGGKNAPNSFKIKSVNPDKPLRVYDHNLEIKIKNRFLTLINRVNIDYYVAGVVESENGIKQNFEYYKMKSIICRTYALSNLRRHEEDGYNLCDQVHCQVYKSKNRYNDDILMGAMATTGMVIVDSNLKLITAAFHSNCGGQTLNSEDVWSLPTSYLKSVTDTFCLRQPHAHWEQRIPKKDWVNYLKKNYKMQEDPVHTDCFLNFHQEERVVDFISHNIKVPLKNIRHDFRLKSTYFIFENDGESIVLKGRGFGHGIGLCQEGAMRMSELGFKSHEILHYYYKNIHLVDLSVLDFFRSEN